MKLAIILAGVCFLCFGHALSQVAHINSLEKSLAEARENYAILERQTAAQIMAYAEIEH